MPISVRPTDESALDAEGGAGPPVGGTATGDDAEYAQAPQIAAQEGKASTSYLQCRLRIGYNSAAPFIERMEADGHVSRPAHVGHRQVLIGGAPQDGGRTRGKGWAALSWLGQFAGLLGLAWVLASQTPLAARPTATDDEDLGRVEAYLNGLTTLKADFIQTNPDNVTVTGELYYQRPDKMRLEYDPPSDILIVSDGWHIVYYDQKLEQVSYLPPNSTPLGFLLRDVIRLSGDVTVTDVVRRPGELRLTLARTSERNEGTITLTFTDDPIALRRWTVTDAQGQVTGVTLVGLQTDLPLDEELFRFRDPTRSR